MTEFKYIIKQTKKFYYVEMQMRREINQWILSYEQLLISIELSTIMALFL